MPKSFNLSAALGLTSLAGYLKQVEDCIDASISPERSLMGKAVTRLTKARGKRLRPALVIASALLSGKNISRSVIRAAAAVELLHIGSLVHDDIIDKASTRWQVATINAKEGLDQAIIGGDFLFAKACVIGGEVNREIGMIVAETITRLCSGQSAEIDEQYNVHRTEARLKQASYDKTAALLAAACRIGGICTDQPDTKLEALVRYGADFGMGFQLLDDVLDFISADSLLGKPAGNDVKEGVYSLPVILSLRGPQRAFVEKELAKKTSSSKALTKLLLEDGSIDTALRKVQEYNAAAEKTLMTVFDTTALHLARLPNTYLEWALSNLVAPRYEHLFSMTASTAR